MKPALTAIVMLALVEVARAADDVKFYPPDGWTVARQPNGATALQPPGVPAGKTCTVLIMPDLEAHVNVAFATGWQTLTAQVKVVSGGDVRVGRTMAGLETRWTTGVVDAPDTGRACMHFFTVQNGPRVRRALYVSDEQARFDQHLPTVKAMLDAVGVDPETAKKNRQALAAKGESTGFDGVFYLARIGFDPAGARGDVARRVDYLCFGPDGRAYNGHPSGGPVACLEEPDPRSPSYGWYTLAGDDIVVTWNRDPATGRQQTQKLKRLPDGKLDQDGAAFHRLAPCDGLKPDGTYSITWADGSETRITFTKDGRFTERGLKDCANLDHADWPKLPPSGAGTYSIARNTLEVKYDNNGPARRMFFASPDDPANPRRISIASNLLEREP